MNSSVTPRGRVVTRLGNGPSELIAPVIRRIITMSGLINLISEGRGRVELQCGLGSIWGTVVNNTVTTFRTDGLTVRACKVTHKLTERIYWSAFPISCIGEEAIGRRAIESGAGPRGRRSDANIKSLPPSGRAVLSERASADATHVSRSVDTPMINKKAVKCERHSRKEGPVPSDLARSRARTGRGGRPALAGPPEGAEPAHSDD
ncbi:hypothetical protein EVAR_18832_1 [Eumeta japonica]|uniref:Uncharacterized protein n=1 Tax=Eumeta variegata TaxID=151549 RepID=A0A4C1UMY5_EUMVA|nr:hypothetical protein EVAR_18832_1 [Eumeta japonica]